MDFDDRRIGGTSVGRALNRESRLSIWDFRAGSTGAVCFLESHIYIKHHRHFEV